MTPEFLLINTPRIDFRALTSACQQVLGYSPTRAVDATDCEWSDAEKFLSCLAAMRDKKAPAGFAAHFLSHALVSLLLVADDRDLLDILNRCSGMAFVTADTTLRGVSAAVVSGTLAQWRDAVVAASTRATESSVRLGFNKVYGLFGGAGLNVWGDYRTHDAPDKTLLLEYKPR